MEKVGKKEVRELKAQGVRWVLFVGFGETQDNVRTGVEKKIDQNGVRCTRGSQLETLGETGQNCGQQEVGVRARRPKLPRSWVVK